jgi:hypothetical protein
MTALAWFRIAMLGAAGFCTSQYVVDGHRWALAFLVVSMGLYIVGWVWERDA